MPSQVLINAIAPYSTRSYSRSGDGRAFDAQTALDQIQTLNQTYGFGLTEAQLAQGIIDRGNSHRQQFGQPNEPVWNNQGNYDGSTPAPVVAIQSLLSTLQSISPAIANEWWSRPEIQQIQNDGNAWSNRTFQEIAGEQREAYAAANDSTSFWDAVRVLGPRAISGLIALYSGGVGLSGVISGAGTIGNVLGASNMLTRVSGNSDTYFGRLIRMASLVNSAGEVIGEPPTDVDVTPTDVEVTPTDTDVTPTDVDVSPTDTDVTPTDVDVAPTDIDVTPTDTGVTPTDTDVAPTDTDVTPNDVDVSPTDTKVIPTETDVTTVDEPVIDEPVVDEPVVDEPVIDEPATTPRQGSTFSDRLSRRVLNYGVSRLLNSLQQGSSRGSDPFYFSPRYRFSPDETTAGSFGSSVLGSALGVDSGVPTFGTPKGSKKSNVWNVSSLKYKDEMGD